jgi:ribose transport system substrate-binding protein
MTIIFRSSRPSGLRASLLALASAAALLAGHQAAHVAEGVAPIADRPEPVANEAGTKTKIAIIGFANNPYWIAVQKGAETANDVLKSRGGEVRWIVGGANIDVPTVNQAINAAATQGYNGIGFFIAGEGNCALIKKLIAEKKISIGAYNTLFPCVEEAGGVINYAQDQFAAGKNAAAELVKAVGDKEGKVGVIVSQFTAPGSEQRRKGFVEGLAGLEALRRQRRHRGQGFGRQHLRRRQGLPDLHPRPRRHLRDGRRTVRRRAGGEDGRQAGRASR